MHDIGYNYHKKLIHIQTKIWNNNMKKYNMIKDTFYTFIQIYADTQYHHLVMGAFSNLLNNLKNVVGINFRLLNKLDSQFIIIKDIYELVHMLDFVQEIIKSSCSSSDIDADCMEFCQRIYNK